MAWEGLGPLDPIWRELARRMGASDRPVRRIAIAGLDEQGRRALAGLLKLPKVPDEPEVTIDVTRVGAALGLSNSGQLRRLVERLHGPIGNRAAIRAATSVARASLWALAQDRIGARVPHTLARIRAAGVPGGDIDAHARTLDVLALCLDLIPASSPVALPMLAWQVSGDPHALDANTACGRYLQLAAVELTGACLAEPDGVAVRRALQALGVVCDRLSSSTITYGVRAYANSPLGRLLEAGISARAPVHVSGALIDAAPAQFLDRIWLCVENPSVVEAALTVQAPGALVCTSGWPSIDTQRLLEAARAQGIELQFAGDYDSVGLIIAHFMSKRFGAQIVMTRERYLAADLSRAPEWGTEPVQPTHWDAELAPAIQDRRRIVYQEDPAIWRELVERTASSPARG